jgi:MFS transporter, ACS family, hexuronate transporter
MTLTRSSISRAVVLLLLSATTINYINRETLSVLAPVILKELHISSLGYAFAVNAFLGLYAVMYLLMGRVVDRLGTRNGLGYAVIFWSVVEMLHATAVGMITLCVYRALLAIGEAAIVPGCIKAVAEWFDARQRGVVVGTFEMGFGLGALIAPPLVGWIALRQGWRAAFFYTGLLGLIWVVPWFMFYRSPEKSQRGDTPDTSSPAPQRPMAWTRLLGSREMWAVGFARFFSDPVWYFYLFWIPKFLSDSQGLSLKAIAEFAWIPYLASMVGTLSGGAGSSWLVRRGVPPLKAREYVMFAGAVLVSSGVLCIYLSHLLWVLVVMSISAFAMQFWGANLDTLVIDIFPSVYAAETMGFAGMMGSVGGILFTFGTGYAVQHYSYRPVWIASAMMYPAGLALLVFMLGTGGRARHGRGAHPEDSPPDLV